MAQSAQLPSLDFFAQGNVMTGSCTPERLVGNLRANIFNYRVKSESGDDGKTLVAEYFIGNTCFALADAEKINKCSFELSEQGVSEAQNWLTGEYTDFLRVER